MTEADIANSESLRDPLQLARTVTSAAGAFPFVVGQQQFDSYLADFAQLFGVGADDHSRFRWGRTGAENATALNIDNTETA